MSSYALFWYNRIMQSDMLPSIKRPTERDRRGYIFAFLLLVALALTIAGAGGLLIAYERKYRYRIFRGVRGPGFPLGGLTRSEARERLEEWAPSYTDYMLVLRYRGQRWTVTLDELGAEVDVDAMVDAAYALGRSGVFLDDLREQMRLLWHGRSIQPVLVLNEGKCAVFLGRLAREIDQPFHNATLSTTGMQVHLLPSRAGRELDVPATCKRLRNLLATVPLASEMELVVREITPPILDAERAKAEAEQIIGEPITLVLHDRLPDAETGTTLRPVTRCWTLDRAMLASMITVRQTVQRDGQVGLEIGLNRSRLTDWVKNLAPEINRPPRDARLNLEPSRMELIPLIPHQDGLTLLVTDTVRLIEEALASGTHKVPLAVKVTPPRISLDNTQQLGIRELISRGETSFKGSSAERAHNIKTAASHFDGVIILPGETFSFLEHLGPVNAATGYEQSWIIFGDRTVLGPGGGVCQVSTTCFRAAFWGGFPIIERWPHAYRVGWYEPPIGLDAAVFAPSVDMKFINDTDHAIMIKTRVNAQTGELVFEFYGTKPDRTVEMEGPELSRRVPKPDPVYEFDPSLPPGTTKQVERGREGIDVTIYRIIRYGNGEEKREKFFSRFQPWPDRFLVGPTPVPTPSPQPTPAVTPSPPSEAGE